jgi:hypothetical protein
MSVVGILPEPRVYQNAGPFVMVRVDKRIGRTCRWLGKGCRTRKEPAGKHKTGNRCSTEMHHFVYGCVVRNSFIFKSLRGTTLHIVTNQRHRLKSALRSVQAWRSQHPMHRPERNRTLHSGRRRTTPLAVGAGTEFRELAAACALRGPLASRLRRHDTRHRRSP